MNNDMYDGEMFDGVGRWCDEHGNPLPHLNCRSSFTKPLTFVIGQDEAVRAKSPYPPLSISEGLILAAKFRDGGEE